MIGSTAYELTNHLGNAVSAEMKCRRMLATISDKKVGHSTDGTTVDYYTAEVLNQTDYYSFGMTMPGRKYGGAGRYGFNGKEDDKEVAGQQDYGMRFYDKRLGRFKSIDPLASKYPELTPYQFASNRPIDGVDLDGKEYLPTFPKFENSGNRTLSDYAGGIDNAVIDILNLVPSTWNAGVNTIRSVVGGTFNKGFKNELTEVSGALKELGMNLATKPITTLTSPEAVNFAVSGYIGAKVFTIVGNAKNLLTSGTSTTVEKTLTVYRGVNESHVDFAIQSKGIVKPNGGNATPLEHNIGSTLNSPFTSWTTNPEVAENFALRPSGSGVVLKKNIPVKEMIPSPNRKEVLLKNTNKRVSESEVLLKGRVKVPKKNIKKVSN